MTSSPKERPQQSSSAVRGRFDSCVAPVPKEWTFSASTCHGRSFTCWYASYCVCLGRPWFPYYFCVFSTADISIYDLIIVESVVSYTEQSLSFYGNSWKKCIIKTSSIPAARGDKDFFIIWHYTCSKKTSTIEILYTYVKHLLKSFSEDQAILYDVWIYAGLLLRQFQRARAHVPGPA